MFRDRVEAGELLATMLQDYRGTDALVLGIPAGGVPVAAAIAAQLALALDVAVVSKATLPWNTEAGYGAVAFDGTVRLNKVLLSELRLTDADIEHGIAETREKVARRVKALRGDRLPWDLKGRSSILVDDGLASGFTMRVAVEALRNCGAGRVIVAVPTAHRQAVRNLGGAIEEIHCANIRSGGIFAVADAYQHWYDVGLEEVRQLLARFAAQSAQE